MIRGYFNNPENRIVTDISGGREHYTARPRYIFKNPIEYKCIFGDTFYSLSAKFIEEDKNWEILADCNKPINPFDLEPSDTINIPKSIIEIKTPEAIIL
jgi:hypothetical protein